MTLLESALACPKCVVSVMGDHAGEGPEAIFGRKQVDIERTGKTFWLVRSPKARPADVQRICAAGPAYVIFVEPSTKGGARPTTEQETALEFSDDKVRWHPFPERLGPVTGKLDNGATALVFDSLTTDVDGQLDLWNYREASEIIMPLKFKLGCSTICAVKNDTASHPDRMKSRFRNIVALARLAHPFGVWVR